MATESNRQKMSISLFDPRRYRQPTFVGVDFHSPSIAQWVGYTHMQDSIIAKYHDGTLFPYAGDSYTEFVQPVPDLGSVAIAYYPSSQYSVDDFSMGLQFVPVLSLLFDTPKTGAEVIDVVDEIDTLFSFILGMPINIEKIRLITLSGRIHPLSLYSPRAQKPDKVRRYPFFPLGKNLRADHLGLPPLPIELFSTYFCLAKTDRVHFRKYVKYRSLENPEERFLGFFRLLEKLCFQKESFLPEEKLVVLIKRAKPFLVRYFGEKKNVERVLERMIGWNNSKLNAASCIVKFMKKIPKNLLKRWIYGSSDINDICKLRNDLTHANEVEPEAYEIDKNAKFIEVLLVMRLLMAIGVSVENAALIAPRIQGHTLIEKPVEVRVTTVGA